MLGQAISMLLPQVIGYKLVGTLNKLATSTDLVLTITKVIFLVKFLFSVCLIRLDYYLYIMCMTCS